MRSLTHRLSRRLLRTCKGRSHFHSRASKLTGAIGSTPQPVTGPSGNGCLFDGTASIYISHWRHEQERAGIVLHTKSQKMRAMEERWHMPVEDAW